MRELSFADRVWLNRFRSDHSEMPAPHRAGNYWVATVPLPGDGEQTRTFRGDGAFAGMRAWLERWADGG